MNEYSPLECVIPVVLARNFSLWARFRLISNYFLGFFWDFFVIFNFVKVEWSDKIYDIFCTGSSNHGVERPDTDARRGVNFLRSFRPERVLPSGAASLAAQAT